MCVCVCVWLCAGNDDYCEPDDDDNNYNNNNNNNTNNNNNSHRNNIIVITGDGVNSMLVSVTFMKDVLVVEKEHRCLGYKVSCVSS